MILDLPAWSRLVGAFARVLILLILVGLILPRLAIVVADFLVFPQDRNSPELRFQENVQRVVGFRRVGNSVLMQYIEDWFDMVSVELRHYYYQPYQ